MLLRHAPSPAPLALGIVEHLVRLQGPGNRPASTSEAAPRATKMSATNDDGDDDGGPVLMWIAHGPEIKQSC